MNSITFFLFFIPILALLLLGLNLIFAPHNPYQEKSSTFECGFHSFLGQNRMQFSISFFIFGILFLVFDLELVMTLPGFISIYSIQAYGISFMLIFFFILAGGFAFELGKKALSIDSKQQNTIIKSLCSLTCVFQYIKETIVISMQDYYKKFNIFKLIIGFIKLKFIMVSAALVLFLFDIICIKSVIPTASTLILALILHKFIITPWRDNFIANLFLP